MNRDDRYDLGEVRGLIVFVNSFRAESTDVFLTMSEALAHARNSKRAARVVPHGQFFRVAEVQ